MKDKTVFITGASSGIGKETAILLDNDDASLFITGRNDEKTQQTLSLLKPGKHSFHIADLNDMNQVEEITDHMPEVDGMVMSAGITMHTPAVLINQKMIDEIFSINFSASVLLIKRVLNKRKLNRGGSVVFLSSVATKHPYHGGGMYIASKKALEGYAEVLALELSPKKIRVNCISPSFVETPMLAGFRKMIPAETLERLENSHPLGLGTTAQVAKTIRFLLSDESSWITGQNIVLGGI